MKIEITSNIGPSSRYFKSLTKQIEYAGIQTANQLAFAVRQEAHSDMARIFDRPKPNFTLRSMVVEKATRMKPYAWVGLRKDGGFRRSLSAHFTGGDRRFKKFEGWLRAIKALPDGMIALPSSNMPLDQYGNIPVGTIRKIMNAGWSSKLGSGALVAAGAKRRTKRVASLGYFVVPYSDKAKGLTPGVYERLRIGKSTSVKIAIIFGKKGQYDRVIKLEEIAARVGVSAGGMFSANLAKALSTARF
jgi:hypothetical protein